MKDVGYNLEAVSTGMVVDSSPTAKMILFKESEITNLLKQFEISQGMFRAFSMLAILEFLQSNKDIGTILATTGKPEVKND